LQKIEVCFLEIALVWTGLCCFFVVQQTLNVLTEI